MGPFLHIRTLVINISASVRSVLGPAQKSSHQDGSLNYRTVDGHNQQIAAANQSRWSSTITADRNPNSNQIPPGSIMVTQDIEVIVEPKDGWEERKEESRRWWSISGYSGVYECSLSTLHELILRSPNFHWTTITKTIGWKLFETKELTDAISFVTKFGSNAFKLDASRTTAQYYHWRRGRHGSFIIHMASYFENPLRSKQRCLSYDVVICCTPPWCL